MISIFNQKRKMFFALAIVFGVLALGAPHAQAANKTWDGSTSTDWTDGTNWSSNSVPSGNDNIRIPGGLTNYPVISSTVTGLTGTITVNNTGSNASLTVNTGGSLTLAGGLTISSTGTLNVSGGTISMASNKITDNGTLNFSSGSVNVQDIDGSGSISMTGGTLTIGRDFKIANPSQFTASGGTVIFTGTATGGAFLAGTYYFYNLAVVSGNPGFSSHSTTIVILNSLSLSGGVMAFSGVDNTAKTLYIGGFAKTKGTWGSMSSSALNQNDTYFSGAGIVTVLRSPSTKRRAHDLYPDPLSASVVGAAEHHEDTPATTENTPPKAETPQFVITQLTPTDMTVRVPITFGKSLGLKATGDEVIALQKFLTDLGVLKLPEGMAFGYYGQLTAKAVCAFQQEYGIAKKGEAKCGLFGPKTRAQAGVVASS